MTFYLEDKRKCDVTDTFFILDYESEALFQNLFILSASPPLALVRQCGLLSLEKHSK